MQYAWKSSSERRSPALTRPGCLCTGIAQANMCLMAHIYLWNIGRRTYSPRTVASRPAFGTPMGWVQVRATSTLAMLRTATPVHQGPDALSHSFQSPYRQQHPTKGRHDCTPFPILTPLSKRYGSSTACFLNHEPRNVAAVAAGRCLSGTRKGDGRPKM